MIKINSTHNSFLKYKTYFQCFCIILFIFLIALCFFCFNYVLKANLDLSEISKLNIYIKVIFISTILFLIITFIFYFFGFNSLFKLVNQNFLDLELKNKELTHINKEVEKTLKISSNINHELSRSNIELSIKENENLAIQEQLKKSLTLIQNSKVDFEKTNKLFQSQSQDLYDLYNNAPIGYFTLDKNGNLTSVNKTALFWIGYTQTEVDENPKFEFYVAESSKSEYLKAVEKAIISGKFINILLNAVHKNGYEMAFSLNAYTLYDDKNEVTKIRCTCIDMRQQIKHENELKKALLQTENANKAKTEFLNMLSHELRTPIHGIIGNSSLLRSSILNQTQQNYVNDIEKNGDYLSKMIQNILDYIQLDTHKIEFNYKTFNIKETIKSAVEKSKQKVINPKVEISVLIEEMEEENFISDEVRLEQALVEIITNSLVFTKNGTISIKIKQVRVSNSLYRLCFEITDTGIGIEDEDLKIIFLPFKQISETHSRNSGGTGLGLALTQKIIFALNGQIEVFSKIGKGTTVQFHIEAKSENQGKTKTKNVNYTLSKNPLEAKILVAEDTEMNQVLLLSMLRNLGLKADLAIDGLQALEKATHTFYDLILMDISMPVKDGITASKEILEFYKNRKIKPIIVAVTANSLIGDKEKYIEAGMADCLSKPLKQEHLKEMIGKFFETDYKENTIFSKLIFDTLLDWTIINQIKETALSLENDLDKVIFSMAKKDIPEFINEAEALLINGKKEDVQKMFHKIKGAAWSSGLKTLGDTCKNYEEDLKNGKENVDFTAIHHIAKMSFDALEKV